MPFAGATLEAADPRADLDFPEATPTAGAHGRPHLVGRVDGPPGGPLLVVLGGIHGNEPAGLAALGRVLAEIELGPAPLAGTLVALAGNRGALAVGRRYLDSDLNRLWTPGRLAALQAGEEPENRDEQELAGLDREIEALLAEAPGRIWFLDLHTTSGPGLPFVVLDDALPSRRFALELSVPVVLGLEEELAGTLVFRLSARGVPSVAFEGGGHADPRATDRCEAAIWLALAAAGLLPRTWRARAEIARRLLEASLGSAPRLVEVCYRHSIRPQDGFRMRPGFASFQPVAAGEPLGDDREGSVTAPRGALMLMPLYQELGSDGFFLVRPVARSWFELSAFLRRARADRFLAWLPGIARDRESPDTFRVKRSVARFLVREIFHLLGYRRLPDTDGHARFRRRADAA